MAEPTDAPSEDPHFETDTVEANRAVENGQGLGAREIAAHRDPGGVSIPDVDPGDEDEDLDDSVSVQGDRDDSTRDDAAP